MYIETKAERQFFNEQHHLLERKIKHDTTQHQSHWDELANLSFPNGYPTEEARMCLLDEHYFQRAVQVYLGAEEAKGANLVELLDLFIASLPS